MEVPRELLGAAAPAAACQPGATVVVTARGRCSVVDLLVGCNCGKLTPVNYRRLLGYASLDALLLVAHKTLVGGVVV